MKKIKEVCTDIKQFELILQLISEDRKEIARNLISEIIFISKTLEELKQVVKEHGTVDLFEQGKQKFMRESPALKAYNTTIQRYSLLCKQLIDMLPKQTQDTTNSELYNFIK